MKLLWTILMIAALTGLQWRLWVADGGRPELEQLQAKVAEQTRANDKLRQRNQDLMHQVKALQQSDAAIEQYARLHLGMIKPGETFFRFVPSDSASKP